MATDHAKIRLPRDDSAGGSTTRKPEELQGLQDHRHVDGGPQAWVCLPTTGAGDLICRPRLGDKFISPPFRTSSLS
jgi:hypothetical protein